MDFESFGAAIAAVGVPAGGAVAWAWYRFNEKHKSTIDEYQEFAKRQQDMIGDVKADNLALRQQVVDADMRCETALTKLRADMDGQRARYDERLATIQDGLNRARIENEALRGRYELASIQLEQVRAGIHPVFASMELLNTACIVADESGRIVMVNPFVTFLLHWLPRDLIGRPLCQIIPPRLRAAHAAGWQGAISRQDAPSLDRHYATYGLTKQGDEVPILVRLTGWKDSGKWMFCALIGLRPGTSDEFPTYTAQPSTPPSSSASPVPGPESDPNAGPAANPRPASEEIGHP